MTRPKPKVILEQLNKVTKKVDQVLVSEGVWAVFYDGGPINLKEFHSVETYPGPKYAKVSFPNPGHAVNLCIKLNAQYKTDKFTVVFFSEATQIYPIVEDNG